MKMHGPKNKRDMKPTHKFAVLRRIRFSVAIQGDSRHCICEH